MIEVAGVKVPRGAIANLVVRLHRERQTMLAYQLGHGIDQNRDSISLAAHDARVILATLTSEPIGELEPLRNALGRTNGHSTSEETPGGID